MRIVKWSGGYTWIKKAEYLGGYVDINKLRFFSVNKPTMIYQVKL